MRNVLKIIVLMVIFTIVSIALIAQPPPPSGDRGNQHRHRHGGGNAPIREGVAVLLVLGIVYGGYRLVKYKFNKLED